MTAPDKSAPSATPDATRPLTMSAKMERDDRRFSAGPWMPWAPEALEGAIKRAHTEIDALRAALSGSPDEPASLREVVQAWLAADHRRNATDFRALLDWFMCSDPWPVTDTGGGDGHATIEAMLNREARARGFDGWVVAFHEFKPAAPALASPDEPRATVPVCTCGASTISAMQGTHWESCALFAARSPHEGPTNNPEVKP